MGSTGARKAGLGGGAGAFVTSQQQQPQQPQPTIVATPSQAQTANAATFSDTDDQDYHDLYNGRQYYQSQTFNIDTQYAIQDYLSSAIDPDDPSGMYSFSQRLNYDIEHGNKLDANEQFVVDSLNDGMHNLGYNINLTHYGRLSMIDGIGNATGVNVNSSNYANMSQAQLNQLVGKTFSIDRFVSTSYNNFKNAPNGGAPFTDKAVELRIKAPAKAQGLMPGNGPGGALGEIVLKPGQNYKITGIQMPKGQMGRSGGGRYQKIIYELEIV